LNAPSVKSAKSFIGAVFQAFLLAGRADWRFSEFLQIY
jgi:hypothetical protein